ncbi:unnamed protein product, partial [Adineta steineri]
SNNITHVPIDLNLTIYADPLPTIDIYKDGQQLILHNQINSLPSGDIFTHYRIYLNNLNDTGLYEYRINNSFGSVSYSKHINIAEQQPFIQSISNQTISIGKQYTLICYASGQPNLQLKWIDETTKQILNTSLISPILLTTINTKSNIYTCQAKNSYGEYSVSVYVTIQIPSKILSLTTNRTIKINETLDIFCIGEGDNDFQLKLQTPSLKNVHMIETKSEYKKTLAYSITNIQMSDNGIYECNAKNNYSQDHGIFEIIVQNIPNRIENIFLENSNRISWFKPYDGNAKILKYILRIQYKQGIVWSNATIITINNSDITSYSFDNFYSKCSISITIEAVNTIGSSLPSNPLHFQTNTKQLLIAPNNLIAVNITSKSVILSWEYSLFHLCDNFNIEYNIELIDTYNQTLIQTYQHNSTVFMIENLKSSTQYTFIVYAINELGSSPKSQLLTIQTLESVPLVTIEDLQAILLNTSSVNITWAFENDDVQFLNGKFRTFAVTIYEYFNMSTLVTMETINSNLIFHNLHSSSQYYISVAICNYFDCGPSSKAIHIETPFSNLDMPITVIHPITKPLLLNCPFTKSWLNSEKSIDQYVLSNNSLYITDLKLDDNHSQYQCGSTQYQIQLYDKPSSVQGKIHYTTSNEIGLKFDYPSDIIESLIITYKSKENLILNEFHLFPPLLNIRLTNLSCGNTYDIMIYAKNQAGFSSSEYLIGKTDGSAPSLIQSNDLIETITNNYIILNMSKWKVNQCGILSYDIEIFPIDNSTERSLHRYYSFENHLKILKIPNLQSNQNYHLEIKVHSQAGEINKIILFRTLNNKHIFNSETQHYYLTVIIIIISFILVLVSSIIIFISIKFCRLHFKNTDLFIAQTRKLKPVICSSYPHDYHGTWLKSNNEFTIENYTENNNRPYSYASEDSQGNINPYAVTGWTLNCKDPIDHGSLFRENKHAHCLIDPIDLRPSTTPSERYFRPIILESSALANQESLKRNPLVQIPTTTCILSNQYQSFQAPSSVLSTVSSSQGELFSAFTHVPSSKQTTLNTKKISNHNHILADQSSSSADSGVHSSYTQSPIIKHSFRKCHFHGFLFDRPSSANTSDDHDKHLYATYDQHYTCLRGITSNQLNNEPSNSYRRREQEQYSLV